MRQTKLKMKMQWNPYNTDTLWNKNTVLIIEMSSCSGGSLHTLVELIMPLEIDGLQNSLHYKCHAITKHGHKDMLNSKGTRQPELPLDWHTAVTASCPTPHHTQHTSIQ